LLMYSGFVGSLPREETHDCHQRGFNDRIVDTPSFYASGIHSHPDLGVRVSHVEKAQSNLFLATSARLVVADSAAP
jgi:hypothetical protein